MRQPLKTHYALTSSIVNVTMLLVVIGIVFGSTSTAVGTDAATPATVVLELVDDACVPLVLLAPANSSVALQVQNNTLVDRVVALSPGGASIPIDASSTEVVELQLDAGEYRFLCGPLEAPEAATAELDVVSPAMLEEPPATPLATPLGARNAGS